MNATMTATAKYLFDDGLRRAATSRPITHGRARAPSAPTPRRSAYRNGFAAGEAQGQGRAPSTPPPRWRSSDRQRIERLASRALRRSRRGWRPRRSRSRSRSPRKLAPELIAREPFAEIAALASECFRHLVGDAACRGAHRRRHLRRAPSTSSSEIAAARGFEGRLVVLGRARHRARRLPHRMGRRRRRPRPRRDRSRDRRTWSGATSARRAAPRRITDCHERLERR